MRTAKETKRFGYIVVGFLAGVLFRRSATVLKISDFVRKIKPELYQSTETSGAVPTGFSENVTTKDITIPAAGSATIADNLVPPRARVFEAKRGGLGTETDIGCTGDCLIPNGVLSSKPASFFRAIQQEIDNDDLRSRCQRYNFGLTIPNNTGAGQQHKPRRIFYGNLIADEPWEVMEIIAAETFSIFSGMVLVESNRTQAFHSRQFKRDRWHAQKLQRLFNVSHLQIRQFVNENARLVELEREQVQRDEIVRGWKEMGMGPDDVGYIADLDETFSRDFLRAIQSCPYIEALDYGTHHCGASKFPKMIAATQVFEGSPDCVTAERAWYHPDMVIGACIELIGDEKQHPIAPRSGWRRSKGYGDTCDETKDSFKYVDIAANKYPLWSAGDFRATCGGQMYKRHDRAEDTYTGYHFHNWFSDLNATRFKYFTYGHASNKAMTASMEDMSDDLRFMILCVNNETESKGYSRVKGGLKATLPPWPIYFRDSLYRQHRHEHLKQIVQLDKEFQRNNQ